MASYINIPKRLPILTVSENVLLPGASLRISVKSLPNMNLVKSRLLKQNSLRSTIIGVVLTDEYEGNDSSSGMHAVGTAAVVVQVTGTNWPSPSYTLLVTGICRFKMEEVLQETPYLVALVKQLDKLKVINTVDDSKNEELRALSLKFKEHANQLVDLLDVSQPTVAKLKRMLESVPIEHLPDLTASIVKASHAEKLQVLDALDVTERFRRALPLLLRQIEGLNLMARSRSSILPTKRSRYGQGSPHRRAHQLRKALGSVDADDDDHDEDVDILLKIKEAKLPEAAERLCIKEFKRLQKMPQQMPEYAMIRNYLDLMVELPWSKESKDVLDINQAKKDLDADHYGLEDPKKRVIEYLAVRQLTNSLKGPILCLVGPPGVGKTSIGKSIAHTLGREFYRISLGGVCDQSDIRGHRRTYIGSMPGRIIQGLKIAGTRNPVILLDEVDKMSRGVHGDPSAALLEVLDPEQNHTFVDHYVNTAFDLSQVLFIATANSVESIPSPLLDRMEMISLSGYTPDQKVHIARGHLLPKLLSRHGLTPQQLQIPDDSLLYIVTHYTLEAGVRHLEHRLGAICRAVAVKVAESRDSTSKEEELTSESPTEDLTPPELPIVIDEAATRDILGTPKWEQERRELLDSPGVAVGLAWTPQGGKILFVEASKIKCSGSGSTLSLTGQLGKVLEESATLAWSWVRSNALKLGIRDDLSSYKVHIHFPQGSISKDGPSAGVAVVSVLVSLFTSRCARSDTAMTGEITLRGKVLPVGGVKEKVLAAHRAGIRRVILPHKNKKDVKDIPASVQENMTFIFAERIEDVLAAAFNTDEPNPATALPISKL